MLALVNFENSPVLFLKRLTMRPDHFHYHFQKALECSFVECLTFVTGFVTDQLVAAADFVVNYLIAVAIQSH